MAYLGMCTMDMVEYVNPLTGETTYGSSSCPPEGFVRVGEVDAKKQGFPVTKTGAEQYDLIEQRVQPTLTPIQQAPAQGGGLALAAIAAFLLLG